MDEYGGNLNALKKIVGSLCIDAEKIRWEQPNQLSALKILLMRLKSLNGLDSCL